VTVAAADTRRSGEPAATTPRLAGLEAHPLAGGLRLAVARTRRERGLGLARLDALGPGEALLLPRCRSVHTFGMRFALDIIFLDAEGEVVRIAERVPRRRVVTALSGRSVVECAAGCSGSFLAARVGALVAEIG